MKIKISKYINSVSRRFAELCYVSVVYDHVGECAIQKDAC